MKDYGRRNITPELGSKTLKRNGGILLVALHLDRIDVVRGRNLGHREHEVNLHSVRGVLAVVVEVKIEFLPGRAKHLRDGILDDHPLVHFELAEEDGLHDVGKRGLVLRKRMTDQQRMLVFLPNEFLDNITFPGTTRTLDHERVLSLPFTALQSTANYTFAPS